MKRILEFLCMALGIPTVYVPLLVIAAIAILAWSLSLCCGCSSEETIDRINGLPSDDKINDRYSHVSKSAPESLKPYYDADLTRKLNE